MTNLDDVEALQNNDPGKMFEAIWDFPEQCEKAREIGQSMELPVEYRGASVIMVTGMGGSAIGGDFLRLYGNEKLQVPLVVNRDYTLPGFVNENTLIFAVSYSGNTEETLSVYKQAKEKKAKVVAITTGGKLKDLCEQDGTPFIVIPSGISPRAAMGYLLVPTLTCMEQLGYLQNVSRDIDELIQVLRGLREKLGPKNPEENNLAKQIARRLADRIPVIWSTAGNTEVVSTRWKGQINENGKALAYWAVFPELNHNEIVGFEQPVELLKRIEIIVLRDKEDHPRVQKRMEVTKDVIQEVVSGITEVWSEGEGKLARLLSLTYVGDFVSVYIASMYGIDPTPVKSIDYLKNQLAQA